MTDKRAVAIRKIAEGLYELADVLFDQPGQATETSVGTYVAPSGNPAPVTQPAPSSPLVAASAALPPAEDWATEGSLLDEIFPDDVKAPPRDEPAQGSLAMCPKHKRAFAKSKFKGSPDYCSAKSDDPVWSKNGFCSINARNVDTWLKAQAAAITA